MFIHRGTGKNGLENNLWSHRETEIKLQGSLPPYFPWKTFITLELSTQDAFCSLFSSLVYTELCLPHYILPFINSSFSVFPFFVAFFETILFIKCHFSLLVGKQDVLFLFSLRLTDTCFNMHF